MALNQSQLTTADNIILVGFFVIMLGIGFYFYRHMKGLKDYFSGGNKIPWWLSGVSFYMSAFSAFAFITYSALAYKYGFVPITIMVVSIGGGMLVSVLFFAVKWRRLRINSPVEYLENRYSSVVRQAFAWQGLPIKVIDDALKLLAVGMFVRVAFGVNLQTAVLTSGLIMIAYTVMGGLWAVTVTAFVQFVIMAVGMAVLIPLSLDRVGGLSNFIDNAPEGFFSPVVPEYNWIYIMTVTLVIALSYSSVHWALIQRYYCVPTENDARKVGWFVLGLFVVTPFLMVFPAMAANQYMPGVEEINEIYPRLCLAILPPGLVGLIVATMFSATMSMISSDYNVCANVLTQDIYHRHMRPQASQRELVVVGRMMTLLVGFLSLGLAFYLMSLKGEELFRGMIKLFSVFTAPVAIPMMLGVLVRWINNKGAIACFAIASALGLVLFFGLADQYEYGGVIWMKETLILFATTGTSVVVVTVVSLLSSKSEQERRRSDGLLAKIKVPVGYLPEDAIDSSSGSRTISPYRIVGISTLLISGLMAGVLPLLEKGPNFRMNVWSAGALLILGLVMTFGDKLRKSKPMQGLTEVA